MSEEMKDPISASDTDQIQNGDNTDSKENDIADVTDIKSEKQADINGENAVNGDILNANTNEQPIEEDSYVNKTDDNSLTNGNGTQNENAIVIESSEGGKDNGASELELVAENSQNGDTIDGTPKVEAEQVEEVKNESEDKQETKQVTIADDPHAEPTTADTKPAEDIAPKSDETEGEAEKLAEQVASIVDEQSSDNTETIKPDDSSEQPDEGKADSESKPEQNTDEEQTIGVDKIDTNVDSTPPVDAPASPVSTEVKRETETPEEKSGESPVKEDDDIADTTTADNKEDVEKEVDADKKEDSIDELEQKVKEAKEDWEKSVSEAEESSEKEPSDATPSDSAVKDTEKNTEDTIENNAITNDQSDTKETKDIAELEQTVEVETTGTTGDKEIVENGGELIENKSDIDGDTQAGLETKDSPSSEKSEEQIEENSSEEKTKTEEDNKGNETKTETENEKVDLATTGDEEKTPGDSSNDIDIEQEFTKVVISDEGIPQVTLTSVPDRPPSSASELDQHVTMKADEDKPKVDEGSTNDAKDDTEAVVESKPEEIDAAKSTANQDDTTEEHKSESSSKETTEDVKDETDEKNNDDSAKFDDADEDDSKTDKPEQTKNSADSKADESKELQDDNKVVANTEPEQPTQRVEEEKQREEKVNGNVSKYDDPAKDTPREKQEEKEKTDQTKKPAEEKVKEKPKVEEPVVKEPSPLELLLEKNVEIQGKVGAFDELEVKITSLLTSMKHVVSHYSDVLKLQSLRDFTLTLGKFRGDFQTINEAFQRWSEISVNINKHFKDLRVETDDIKTALCHKFQQEDLNTWIDVSPEKEQGELCFFT